MLRVIAFRIVLWLCLGAFAWMGPACLSARAQDELPPSEEDLKKFLALESRTTFTKFLSGETTPRKQDALLLERAARYYVYRVAVPQREKEPGAMPSYVREFHDTMGAAIRNAGPEFKEMFVHALVKCFQNVMSQDMATNRTSVVNAGLMLEDLGQTGQDEVGDFLAGLAAGAKDDVVRLFAFKGLREFYLANQPKINPFAEDKDRQRHIARLTPVVEALTRKVVLEKGATSEEIAAIQYVRREGIRVLAEARLPAIPRLKDTVKAPAAYVLLRLLAGTKDEVPLSLAEKCEAAIGLCQMKPKVVPSYRPDMAVALVGKFLVEFTQEYRKDHPNFAAGLGAIRKVPLLSWKVQSKRLLAALKEMEDNLPDGTPARKQVQDMRGVIDPILVEISQHRVPGDPNQLRGIVQGLPRPDPMIYQGTPEYQIDLRPWPPFVGG